MFGLGGMEVAVLLGLGVLLFGKRLPEIGKSLGRTVVSFRQGLAGVEDEISSAGSASLPTPPERMPPPRFEGPRDEAASPAI
jgi:sec-independent protein translocase protein TatA